MEARRKDNRIKVLVKMRLVERNLEARDMGVGWGGIEEARIDKVWFEMKEKLRRTHGGYWYSSDFARHRTLPESCPMRRFSMCTLLAEDYSNGSHEKR